MNEIVTLGIFGLYTVIYVVVFIIQRSQIKKSKEINESMKTFMEIFKIDEIKKYVELREETVKMQAQNFFVNSEKVQQLVTEANNESFEQLREIYMNQMGEEHLELVSIVIEVIRSQPKEKRMEFVSKYLPKTQRYFLEMLDDIENKII